MKKRDKQIGRTRRIGGGNRKREKNKIRQGRKSKLYWMKEKDAQKESDNHKGERIKKK